LAGSDTTATGLRATFLYLLTSPKSLHKLLHELRTAVQTGRISSPVTDAEARSLPYLQACIKEGLRIFPPATGLIMKCPPPGGATFLGKFIPEGTKVGYVAWSIFRSKEVYGLDANMFRPERWLEADGPTLERMERSADMLFSPGKWMCLGKNVAMLELNKYFVEVSFISLFLTRRLFFFSSLT
jgi:cytochrome P450